MRQYDILQRFLFEDSDIRGELVHLKACINALSERHPYPKPVLQLLSQALTAVSLLSATIKFEGSLILQTQTDGAIHLLVAQSDNNQHIRGLAKWDEQRLQDTHLLGNGHLAITIIPDNAKEQRYQGVVSMSEESLSLTLETYFAQSEQLMTKVWLSADDNISAGLLLQKLPNTQKQTWEYWEHIEILANTLTEKELLYLENEEILRRLFHEEQVRLFEPTPVIFQCQCSIEKMEQAIVTFGKQAIEEILQTQQVVDVTCEFCNRRYEFDRVDIARIFVSHS